jgi:hypothetical protein
MPVRAGYRRPAASGAEGLDGDARRGGRGGAAPAVGPQGTAGCLARRVPRAVPAGGAARGGAADDPRRGAAGPPEDPAHLPGRLPPARRPRHPQIGLRRQAGRGGGPHRQGPPAAPRDVRRLDGDGRPGPRPCHRPGAARGDVRPAAGAGRGDGDGGEDDCRDSGTDGPDGHAGGRGSPGSPGSGRGRWGRTGHGGAGRRGRGTRGRRPGPSGRLLAHERRAAPRPPIPCPLPPPRRGASGQPDATQTWIDSIS